MASWKRFRNSKYIPLEFWRHGGIITDGNFDILLSGFRLTKRIMTIKGFLFIYLFIYLFGEELEFELRALCLLGKSSIGWTTCLALKWKLTVPNKLYNFLF
jgi:hypothetical protein